MNGAASILISESYRRKFLIQRVAQSKIGEKGESGARGSELRIQTWGDTEEQSVKTMCALPRSHREVVIKKPARKADSG